MLIALLYACAEEPVKEEACAGMPDSASTPPTVLGNEHDCGYWTVALDAQLYVSIVVEEVESPCASDPGEGLEQLYDPIYSNMNNDAPKWTFQILGTSVIEGTTLSVTCDEGTTWHAKVDVVASGA